MSPYTLSTPEGRAEVRRLVDAATPGPWETCRVNPDGVVTPEGDSVAYASSGPVDEHSPFPIACANAALIAAAPTLLLAALEEIERLERLAIVCHCEECWLSRREAKEER